jgi:putative hemolysin
MDPFPAGLIVFALIIASGIFSLFSYALAGCRKTRLEKEQKKSYKAVLAALDNPKKYSLTCNLCGNILKFSVAFFALFLYLDIFDLIYMYYNVAGAWFFYFSFIVYAIVFGILIALLSDALPKLLSRIAPEKIAAALFMPVKIFSFLMAPVVIPALKIASLISGALNIEEGDNSFTEDELRHALIEGEKSGVVESNERTMVEGVLYLGDRPVGAFMTHRSEIEWLDFNEPYEAIRAKALENRKQRCFPVVDGDPDHIVGAVYLEDIILDYSQSRPLGLRAIMKKAQFVPETMSALKAFESFKQSQANSLFVMDEYGGLAGVISITALIEEIVGELSTPVVKEEPIIRQADGSWLADGTLNIDDAAQALSLAGLGEEADDFHTLAGFILSLAGELPKVGDSFESHGYKFTVVDKDGNRIDKLLITKIE